MAERFNVTERLTTEASPESVQAALLAELRAIKPDLTVEDLVKPRGPKDPPILAVQVERIRSDILVTVSQNVPDPMTLGKLVFLWGAALLAGMFTSMIVPLVLVPMVMVGQHLFDKETPYSQAQVEACMKNLRSRLDAQTSRSNAEALSSTRGTC